MGFLKTILFTIFILLSHSLWSAPIHEAAAKGDIQKVERLLSSGVSVNAKDEDEKTPLFHAVESNKKKMVEFLLKNKARLNFPSHSSSFPLQLAMEKNHQDLIELLIKKGARLNFDVDYNSPLIWAIDHKYSEELLKLIIKHKDVDVNERASNSEDTALHLTVIYGLSKSVFQLLIKKGADVNAKNRYKETPLHLAVRFDKGKDFIEPLIKEGADVKAKKIGKETLLHILFLNKKEVDSHLIDFFIKKGLDVNAKDSDGLTPLDYAYWLNGKRKGIEALKKHGAVSATAPPSKKEICLFYDEKRDLSFRIKKIPSSSGSVSEFQESSITKPKKKETIVLEVECKDDSLASHCFIYEYIEVERMTIYDDTHGNFDYSFSALTANGVLKIANIYYDKTGELSVSVVRDFTSIAKGDDYGEKTLWWSFSMIPQNKVEQQKFLRCGKYLSEL